METEVDRYPISELLARYSVGKSKLYADYLGQCKVTPVKIQGRAYISLEDLKRLDEYHAAAGKGKDALAQFLAELPESDNHIIVSRSHLTFISQEASLCLNAIALYYKITCLSQKILLTIPEAVMVSGLSKAGIMKSLHTGELPAIKEGGKWKVRPEDLREYVGKKIDKISQLN